MSEEEERDEDEDEGRMEGVRINASVMSLVRGKNAISQGQ